MSTPTTQALPLRMRRDLVVQRTTYDREPYRTIKDPVAHQFFQLREEEYFVLEALDGESSEESIRQAFDERFAPLKLGQQQLQSYLGRLHSQGLVVADVPGQGKSLHEKRHKRWRAQLLGGLTSILAIRFRGVDPERFLRAIYPFCRWCFSRTFFFATILLAIAALSLVASQYDSMLARLPTFQAFFHFGNLFWIAVALGFVKVLHELGHALACKHFGGECHEMGLMLLVFTPCLYCNVSDAWMMKSKWHRMAISAAGMWVEIVIASVCTFLWWFSEPGLFNAICMNLVFVCSVSTVLFNGNPLLRYDGYYILADWLEVPNMRSQASSLLTRSLRRFCFGVGSSSRALPQRRKKMLITYAIASLIYRFIVVIAILWFLHSWLRPMGLQLAAQIITALMLGGLVIVPLWRFGKFLAGAIESKELNMTRTKVTLVFTAIALGCILLVPLPCHVSAPVVIQPEQAAHVFVDVAGRLPRAKNWVRAGDQVRRGDVLVELNNETVAKEVAKLKGQVEILKQRAKSLATIRVQQDEAGNRLPTVNEALLHAEKLWRQKMADQQRLKIRAPRSGIVLPPKERDEPKTSGQLPAWTGSPLDQNNAGCTLQSGTPFCLIGDPNELEAILVVSQSEIDSIQIGQPVRLQFAQMRGETLTGKVVAIADRELESAPVELVQAGLLAVVPDEAGNSKPVDTSFQVRVRFDTKQPAVSLRTTGQARVTVAPRTLGRRAYDFVCTTFRF